MKDIQTFSPEDREQLAANYRAKVAEALQKSAEYHGTEPQFNEVMETLIAFENWLKEAFGTENRRLSGEEEQELAKAFQPETPGHETQENVTISGILTKAADSFADWIEENVESADILYKKTDGVFLPPGSGKVIRGNSENRIEKGKTVERLKELIDFLNRNGIYTDDIIVWKGKLAPRMMRDESYNLVEIPRLNIQILVCNQVGEGTFLIHGMFSHGTLLKLSKEELLEQFPDKVRQIDNRNKDNWEKQFKAELSDKPKTKVNVSQFDEMRTAIAQKYSLEEWLALNNNNAKRAININGKAYKAIARTLGISDGNILIRYFHFEIAAAIYGEDSPVLREQLAEARKNYKKSCELGNDPDKWRTEIKHRYPFDQWRTLNEDNKSNLDLYGKSLKEIAGFFGRPKTNPENITLDFMELTAIIFEEETKTDKTFTAELEKQRLRTQILLELGNDLDKWREAVKAEYTPEQWIKITSGGIDQFKIKGVIGVNKLATVFGIKNPQDYGRLYFLKLGKEIFGENEFITPALNEAEIGNDKGKLREEIQKQFTAATWAEMNIPKKRALLIGNKQLGSIAHIFGIKGDPVSYHELHLALGAEIFEPNDVATHITPLLEIYKRREEMQKDPQKCKTEILAKYSIAQLEKMTSPQRRNIEVHGQKITFLMRTLGIEGNPFSSEPFRAFLEALRNP